MTYLNYKLLSLIIDDVGPSDAIAEFDQTLDAYLEKVIEFYSRHSGLDDKRLRSGLYKIYAHSGLKIYDASIVDFTSLTAHFNRIDTLLSLLDRTNFALISQRFRLNEGDEGFRVANEDISRHVKNGLSYYFESGDDESKDLGLKILSDANQDFVHVAVRRSTDRSRKYRFYFNLKPTHINEFLFGEGSSNKGLLFEAIEFLYDKFLSLKFGGPVTLQRRDTSVLYTKPLSPEEKKGLTTIISKYTHCFMPENLPFTLPLYPGVSVAKEEGIPTSMLSFGVHRSSLVLKALRACCADTSKVLAKEEVRAQCEHEFEKEGVDFIKPYRLSNSVSLIGGNRHDSQGPYFHRVASVDTVVLSFDDVELDDLEPVE